ncbi:MAG: nucleotide exchange factor GrpE [Gemmatimonadota bacterium]
MTDKSQTPRTETPAPESELQAEAERLAAELDELQRKHDELYEKHLRAHADFDNLRKRLVRERSEEAARAQAELLMQILDALDDLSRAVAVDATTPEARSVLEGFRLVHEKLTTALARAGLEPIATDGERFDPERHEAVMTVPAESPEEDGRIVRELARGYRFGDRLLRPARVQVKRHTPADEGSP